MESMMNTMAQTAFYYYTPDPEARQHGQFIPQPQQMQMYPMVPTLPSTPVYARQPQQMQAQPMRSMTSVPANIMTPMSSPPTPAAAVVNCQQPPMAHRPMIMLETEFCDAEGNRYPSTPPLSTASSTIGSPGSCDMLATPLNPMFSGLDGLKENNVADVASDKFALAGWTSCASPPLTPVYIHPQAQSAKPAPSSIPTSASATSSSDLLSVSACPSLSPSPSPYARSIASEQDNDFCDPRNLTVSTVDGDLSPELCALPSSLCSSDVEDDFVLKVEPQSSDAQNSSSVTADLEHSLASDLPGLEDFPDLESEVDFVNGLVNLGDLSASSATSPSAADLASRSRASSSLSSASDFACEQFFETWESSLEPEAQHASKRQRTLSGSMPVMTAAADSATSGNAENQASSSNDHGSASDNKSDSAGSSGSASPADSGNETPSVAVPTNRRGRKQSLTEDPSKIFACDLCNRRFRRQEHLKRHYRSLHTQEKPFSCHECGKKFSRSDNLAQHARTHGAGAFVMNLYDDPDIVAAATGGYPTHPGMYAPQPVPMGEDYASMGRVLFQVAAEIPGSASDLSSDDGSNSQSKKKRKRAE